MTTLDPKKMAEALSRYDSKKFELLIKVLSDPKRGLEALNFILQQPMPEDSRKRLRSFRDSLEDFYVESQNPSPQKGGTQ